uniref:BZIP domain-containing protein n=1 Tax=Manihot esculenta TaxID=3983 RepID=A0A2C9VYP6_MANES
MRSFPERNDYLSRNSSSPSKSSSTSSSPSSQLLNPSSARQAMEDVWKDINLTCLQDCPSGANHANHPAFPAGMILQDFLARPFNKEPPTEPSSGRANDFLDSLGPRPATMLSLNSGSDFEILESGTASRRPNPQMNTHARVDTPSFGSWLISPLDALGSSSVCPSICKKRLQENHNNSVDRRHKRMMKNRESAARSRARKQESLSSLSLSLSFKKMISLVENTIIHAYTQELELEVANLAEENARLRRQQEKFLAAPAQLPKKHSLYRTSTAPF